MTASATEIAISIRELVKIYPKTRNPAVDGLNLDVVKGSIFGLLGPNGAGKTTTLSILCTLLQATSGQAIILGHDVTTDGDAVRQQIGLVPQDIALYPKLTGRENMRYFARVLGLPNNQIEQRIGECLLLVGLNDCADRLVEKYSGGMKRRANLAVGILHRPAILFLDEPTVGIDAQSRNLILERLVQLKNGGMTIMYTTHYMEEAEQLCDKVAIIDSGRVIACGTPGQLIEAHAKCSNLEELFLVLTGKKLRD